MAGSQSPFGGRPARLGRLGRMLHRARPEDAMIEVTNLFAGSVEVRSVSASAVEAIFERYGIRQAGAFGEERAKLYRDYLYYCLSDRHLTDDELLDLEHLRRVLSLDDPSVAVIHRRVARQVYSRSVDEVLADATIDDAERRFLEHLGAQLDLPAGEAENILEVKTRQRAAKSRVRGRGEGSRGAAGGAE